MSKPNNANIEPAFLWVMWAPFSTIAATMMMTAGQIATHAVTLAG